MTDLCVFAFVHGVHVIKPLQAASCFNVQVFARVCCIFTVTHSRRCKCAQIFIELSELSCIYLLT